MRIAWVTPFNSRSAIARVSAAATQILSERGHTVMIVRSERDATDLGPTLPTRCAVSWWHELSAHDLDAQSDAIVLNIGDHYDFHAGVLAYIDVAPCLGVFHDFYLYDFFNRWVALEGLGEDVHRREVQLTYGETALAVADRAWRNEAGVNEIADVLPMNRVAGKTVRRRPRTFTVLCRSPRRNPAPARYLWLRFVRSPADRVTDAR